MFILRMGVLPRSRNYHIDTPADELHNTGTLSQKLEAPEMAFDAAQEASQLRSLAKADVHSDNIQTGQNSLFHEFGKLSSNPEHLSAVASELERTNSSVSSEPQATIERFNGEVECIVFKPGSLDFGSNPRNISNCNLGVSMKRTMAEEAKRKH